MAHFFTVLPRADACHPFAAAAALGTGSRSVPALDTQGGGEQASSALPPDASGEFFSPSSSSLPPPPVCPLSPSLSSLCILTLSFLTLPLQVLVEGASIPSVHQVPRPEKQEALRHMVRTLPPPLASACVHPTLHLPSLPLVHAALFLAFLVPCIVH